MVPIYELSYCSASQGCADSTDRRIDQRAILRSSVKHNAASGVTGALLCGVNFYAQVLEGDHDAVMRTFRQVETDARHTAVMVLSARRKWHRHFAHWSMAAIDLSGTQNSSLERIMSRAHAGEAAAVPLLHTLLARLVESEPVQVSPAGEATVLLGRCTLNHGRQPAHQAMD